MKFGRTYEAVIQGRLRTWTIGFPFSVQLKTSATGTPSANSATFQFLNLPQEMRNDLSKDLTEPLHYRSISVIAGYESEKPLPSIFVGNIYMAYTFRQGPNWITEVSCLDGGYGIANGSVDLTFGREATSDHILRSVITAMPNVSVGYISRNVFTEERARAFSVSGNPWDITIRRILPKDAQAFISDQKVYILRDNEYIPDEGQRLEISADTGMIGSPKRQAALTTVTMVFEPRLKVGRAVDIISREPYAGSNKIFQVQHQGWISPVVAGDLTTTASFIRFDDMAAAA